MISLRLLVSLFLTEQLWSDWIPLQENWNVFPSSGGLYRIRLDFEEQWLYLGQTSHLRNRLKMLKNAFRGDGCRMPRLTRLALPSTPTGISIQPR